VSGVATQEVAADEAGLRLDRWFRRHYPALTHGRLEKLLRTGQVRVDGGRAKASQRLAAGQAIRVPPMGEAPAKPQQKPAPPVSERDRRALEQAILHMDASVIAIDKPAGLAVQGGTKQDKHLDAMLDALRFGAAERPRLVHRLDRETSGVLLLARTARAAAALTRSFRESETEKLYWAIVAPVPSPLEGRIDHRLLKQPGQGGERVRVDEDEGLRAVTEYRTLDRAGRNAAWLELRPLTGRTHQLRAHCAAIGSPILGDDKYGRRDAVSGGLDLPKGLMLHARAIRIPHPDGGRLSVEAPAPAHFRRALAAFGFDAA
jgi:23S rRNA pseudouridine955/2504/2580 synthase